MSRDRRVSYSDQQRNAQHETKREMRRDWPTAGHYGNADDALLKAYLAYSVGYSPDAISTDGRTLRAYGFDIPDEHLDSMFTVTKSGQFILYEQ
jgi:hypothetical protein